MDCCNNNRCPDCNRPQMMTPPTSPMPAPMPVPMQASMPSGKMTSPGMGSQQPPYQQPAFSQPAFQQPTYPMSSLNSGSCFEQDFPVGMTYVPWQQWRQTYNLPQGLQRGTIFPELDYPFSMGRCR